MTASKREKNGFYHIVLSWQQDGKRKQKSVSTGIPVRGNNKRDVEIARRKILAEWEEKAPESTCDVLFSEYLMQWLEDVKPSIAETTYHSYKHTIEKMICPHFAGCKITLVDLRPHHIQTFYRKRLDAGVSGNTIHHYHANIHKALKDAYRQDLIPDNPASKVTLPRVEKFVGSFYTQEELQRLVDEVRGSKLEVPVMLASWFGLRRGEIIGIRWDAINFEAKTLSVNGTVTNKGDGTPSENEKYRTAGKTKSSLRSFPLSDVQINYLKAQCRLQAENRLMCGSCYNTEWADFVCVDATGKRLHLDYISKMFSKMLKRLELRPIRFHDLRHTNISILLDSGASLKELQEWAGHASFSTTADTYAHIQAQTKKRLTDTMSSLLNVGTG
jgi:integrase